MSSGKNDEAKNILLKASKMNKSSLSETSLTMLNKKIELQPSEDEQIIESEKPKTNLRMILLIANISYIWFATLFVFYGLNINAVYLEFWDKYISFIVRNISIL
jgi:hypothetical protein